nr:hypothetical protein CFP56_13629 [Quercus suber]
MYFPVKINPLEELHIFFNPSPNNPCCQLPTPGLCWGAILISCIGCLHFPFHSVSHNHRRKRHIYIV